MFLSPKDEDMFEESLRIVRHLYDTIRDMSVSEAQQPIATLGDKAERYKRKDTKDTLLVDATAEDIISFGNSRSGHVSSMQRIYETSGVVITEECGRTPPDIDIDHYTPMIISDPIDSSSYFSDIMTRRGQKGRRIGNIFDMERKEVGEASARRHACNSSVTLIKDNMIKYSIVVNLITGEIYAGSRKGVFIGDIGSAKSIGDISTPVEFNSGENLVALYYNAKGKYDNNRIGTNIRCFPMHPFSNMKPVGPMRFTYLAKFGDEKDGEVGAIAHNGEKIQELLPNIAMAVFSSSLSAYKLFCDDEHAEVRGEQEMTPNLANSLYYDGPIRTRGIKSSFLNRYKYPSEFRDTTIIYPSKNVPVDLMLTGMGLKGMAINIV